VANSDLREQNGGAFATTVLRVRPDGPNVVSGDVVLAGTRSTSGSPATLVLCRCGMSKDKPFCDGTHTRMGFKDPGILPPDAPQETLSRGRVTIVPTPNGPFECRGPLTLRGADGRTAAGLDMRLCRCGHSRTKPFCDGSHARVGFLS
jgi:CDGSH-type Zn-finger protein